VVGSACAARLRSDKMHCMLRAVLFDWGDTLMRWEWDEAFVEAGHRAGLTAIGRSDLAQDGAVTARFREEFLPAFWQPGVLEELEYPGLVRDLLARFGARLGDDDLAAFLEAEHAAWSWARKLGATTHALLEALRSRGLKLALVSNAFDPGWLLHRDLADAGVAERIDFAIFSSEVGKRKPHPEIFQRALDALDVAAREALFVGDRLYEDVGGAAGIGMRTVQAVWFRADEHPDGGDPDFVAVNQYDVLNIADRLAA
jgi:putative hydrolase of the HAD superfamily